ncbi:MAG: 3'-5' exonuclease [Synechococcaceae cyanobacterium]|nr:3'-5' exonuclease [Synechococcaceae cyanobacterium]
MHEQASLWDQPDLLGGQSTPLPAASPTPEGLPAESELPGTEAELSPPALVEPTAAVTASAAPALPPITLPALPSPSGRALPRAPERLLILDTETTALTPAEGQVIEVGAVLFHVPSRAVLGQVSFLLPVSANAAEAINGIPAAVSRLPQPWQAGLACFEAMVAATDVLVAHNAAFDRQWFGHGALPFLGKPWICSMEDIRWPAERHLRATPSVRDLALAYGVPVWAAHRALTDCIYLAQVFERCPDLEALLQAALEPRCLYRACVSYAERHWAREAGFRWNEPVPGAWSRRLSQREAEALPFAVQPVAENGEEAPLQRLPRSA